MLWRSLIFLLISSFLLTEKAHSQTDPRAANYGPIIESGTALIEIGAFTVEQLHNIEGSQYYIDEWLPGEALLIENIKSNNINIKIDTYNNEVHLLSGQQILALDSRNIKVVYLEKDVEKIVFKTGFDPPAKKINPNTFLKVIYEGKIKLLAYHSSQIRKSHTSVIATGKVTYEFRHDTDYYLQTADKQFHEVRRLKKKYLLRTLDDHKNKLETFATNNNLHWSNEWDLIKILTYYDEL